MSLKFGVVLTKKNVKDNGDVCLIGWWGLRCKVSSFLVFFTNHVLETVGRPKPPFVFKKKKI